MIAQLKTAPGWETYGDGNIKNWKFEVGLWLDFATISIANYVLMLKVDSRTLSVLQSSIKMGIP